LALIFFTEELVKKAGGEERSQAVVGVEWIDNSGTNDDELFNKTRQNKTILFRTDQCI
jgi:hypothetical protein